MKKVCNVYYRVVAEVYNKKGKKQYTFRGKAREHLRYIDPFEKDVLGEDEYETFLTNYARSGFSRSEDSISIDDKEWTGFFRVYKSETLKFLTLVQVAEERSYSMTTLMSHLPHMELIELLKDSMLPISLNP